MLKTRRLQAAARRHFGAGLVTLAALIGLFVPAVQASSISATESVIYSFGAAAPDGALPYSSLVLGSDGNFYGATYSGGSHSAGTVFRLTQGGVLTTLYSFGAGINDGQYPHTGLVQGSDGNFYGTTLGGGAHGKGTIFRVTPGGSLTTLYSFGSLGEDFDGANPAGGLAVGLDGNFYGTTQLGGTNGLGSIYKVTAGGTLTTLYSFGTNTGDGTGPVSSLLAYSDGSFYGTTPAGGANAKGTIFKMTLTSGFSTLYSFSGSASSDGDSPQSELALGSDGNLYGTTEFGGTNNDGAIYRIAPDGTGEAVVYSFSGTPDGSNPRGGLVLDADGDLYGTTQIGGTANSGSIFKLDPVAGLTIIHSMAGGSTDGANPQVTLAQGDGGVLFGTTLNGGSSDTGITFSISTAGSFTLLHAFGNTSPADGSNPAANLIFGADGNLYGTTSSGGTNGLGTIFSVTTTGTLSTLYTFDQAVGADPIAALLQIEDGSFYGATLNGGASGGGSIIHFTTSSAPQVIHSFGSPAGDGLNPAAPLIEGSDGNFYGTTSGGGANGQGSVFRLTPDGTLTTLYSFGSAANDGSQPLGALVEGSGSLGQLYGTTSAGGSQGKGTVFVITTGGALTTLYSFGSGSTQEGASPEAALILASDGNFYGTTSSGGVSGVGTLFKISPTGTFTTLYNFGGYSGDGNNPDSSLVQDSKGNFYGTTNGGGAHGKGTVFLLSSTGTITSLYSFGTSTSDGSNPLAGLVLAKDGTLYGTTRSGGANGTGAVFKVTVSIGGDENPTVASGGAWSLPDLILLLIAAGLRRRSTFSARWNRQ